MRLSFPSCQRTGWFVVHTATLAGLGLIVALLVIWLADAFR
jgi:hypothetical protein